MNKVDKLQNELENPEAIPGCSPEMEVADYDRRKYAPTLSQIMNARMHELHITQVELGKRLGFSQAYVSRLCRGLVKHPQLSIICRIEEALDVKIVSDLERAANDYQQGKSDILVNLYPNSFTEEMLKGI